MRARLRVRSTLSGPLLSLLLVLPAASVLAAEPAALIRQMSAALKTLNYEGTFIHLQGGSIESMQILHSSDAKGELERMVSLNGEAREVIRNHERVTCIWPQTASVVVSESKPRNALPDIDAALARNNRYELRVGQPDRVAGVQTHVVQVVPRDRLRYGYRFWIDIDTGMLLRFMLLDDRQQALEEVMFTAIDYPASIDPARFRVDVSEAQATWVEPLESGSADGKEAPRVDPAMRIRFADLPAGYEEVSQSYRSMPINDGPVSHVMLSDGMASVSVYVEHVDDAQQEKSALGLSSMGAMNAFGMSLPEGLVTVVGEVPTRTVRQIAEAVELP